jgi:hypothetical protein
MRKILTTAAAIMAVLFITAGTVSAQEKKQVEKKIKIITVNDKGVTKDTTIISCDTLDFECDAIVIDTKDGKIIQGRGKGNRMIMIEKEEGAPGMMAPMIRRMRAMNQNGEAREGVSYHLSFDGVTVDIRAPKEKAKEADQILNEVREILIKK